MEKKYFVVEDSRSKDRCSFDSLPKISIKSSAKDGLRVKVRFTSPKATTTVRYISKDVYVKDTASAEKELMDFILNFGGSIEYCICYVLSSKTIRHALRKHFQYTDKRKKLFKLVLQNWKNSGASKKEIQKHMEMLREKSIKKTNKYY